LPRRAGGACAATAVDLVLQLMMAVASAAARAPAAIADSAVIRCWSGLGAVGGRPAAGACLGVVLASGGSRI
jgi:hypothetical protein